MHVRRHIASAAGPPPPRPPIRLNARRRRIVVLKVLSPKRAQLRMQLRNQLWRRGCEIPPLLWVQDDIEEAARTAVDSYLAGITMRQERAAVGVGGRGPASRWNEDTVRA